MRKKNVEEKRTEQKWIWFGNNKTQITQLFETHVKKAHTAEIKNMTRKNISSDGIVTQIVIQ